MSAASPDALVRVEGVRKSYRSPGGTEGVVLRDLSLELPRGETSSLIGVSGSGKSTLIALLAGLRRPDTGRVVFDGVDIATLDGATADLRATRIGMVLQSGNLIPFLTARENVELALGLAGRRPSGDRARALLSTFGLEARAGHQPRRMSGGETQRVALAMALANDPDLLLADELTGSLDGPTAADVVETVFAAAEERGLTVLFVTHNVDLAARANHRFRLVDGRVVPA